MESRSTGGIEGGGGGRDADHRDDHDDHDDHDQSGSPTLSMDQIRVVARSGNEYTDGPMLGARRASDPPAPGPAGALTPPSRPRTPAEPGPGGLRPPGRHFSLTPCSSTATAPGGSPPRHGGSLSSLERLMGDDETIRTQPKCTEPAGKERKPLTTVVVAGVLTPHSQRCATCGRCVCGECTRPRALPSCWVCGRRCACSAQGVAEVATCVCLVRGLFYHCSSDDEDTCAEKPFSCSQAHCAARWAAVGLLALVLPCIAFYPLACGCAAVGQRCYDAATRPGCRCEGGARRRKGGSGGKTT